MSCPIVFSSSVGRADAVIVAPIEAQCLGSAVITDQPLHQAGTIGAQGGACQRRAPQTRHFGRLVGFGALGYAALSDHEHHVIQGIGEFLIGQGRESDVRQPRQIGSTFREIQEIADLMFEVGDGFGVGGTVHPVAATAMEDEISLRRAHRASGVVRHRDWNSRKKHSQRLQNPERQRLRAHAVSPPTDRPFAELNSRHLWQPGTKDAELITVI